MNNCKYTQSGKELIFNNCRQKAFLSFKKTLDNLYGKENITEMDILYVMILMKLSKKHWNFKQYSIK